MSENPYLSGNFAPVADERSDVALRVTRQDPARALGPAAAHRPESRRRGSRDLSLVHRQRHGARRAPARRPRRVVPPPLRARRRGRRGEGLAARCRAARREIELGGGTANTNVIGHAGKIFAIVEAGNLPVELDAELETVGALGLRRHPARRLHRAPEARPGDGRAVGRRLLAVRGRDPGRRGRQGRPRAQDRRRARAGPPDGPRLRDHGEVLRAARPAGRLRARGARAGRLPVRVEARVRRARRPAAARGRRAATSSGATSSPVTSSIR